MAASGHLPDGNTSSALIDKWCMQRSVRAVLIIAPWGLRQIVQWETEDKKDDETYAEYFAPKAKSSWKKMVYCAKIKKLFETSKNAFDFDVTALSKLLKVSFSIRQGDSDVVLKKVICSLRNVVEDRNALHNIPELRKKSFPNQVEKNLLTLFADARGLYKNVSNEKFEIIEKSLGEKFKEEATQKEKELTDSVVKLLELGKPYNEKLMQKKFSSGYTMFPNEKPLKTEDIFYGAKVVHNNCEVSYEKLLDETEQFIVLVGEPGSGKSTLLNYLALKFYSEPLQMASLNEYELLANYDCQNRTTETFLEMIQINFKDACDKIDDKNVEKALAAIKVVYLVDAFDEISQNSRIVLEKLIAHAQPTDSRVIITTRPWAAESLETLLKRKNALYTKCVLSPLTQKKEKENFLLKYQKSFKKDVNSGELIDSFNRMEPAIIELFDLPIHLVYFCKIYRDSGGKIEKWESFSDFSSNIVDLYKKQVTFKLDTNGIQNLESKIRTFFLEIGRIALEKIAVNSVSFTDDEEKDMRECCGLLDTEIESESVLSVLLKVKQLAGSNDKCYVFHHKSIAEKLAGDFVSNELVKKKDTSFKKILSKELSMNRPLHSSEAPENTDASQNSSHLLDPFREVILNVIRKLKASYSHHFKNRFPELLEDTRGLFTCSEWQTLMLSARDRSVLAKVAFEKTVEEEGKFIIKTNRDAEAVVLMLPYFKKHKLVLQMRPGDVNLEVWRKIVASGLHGVKLDVISTYPYKDCSDLLLPLLNAKCLLTEFEGCLVKQEAVDAIAAISDEKDTELKIRLNAGSPVKLNPALEGKYKELWVYFRPSECSGSFSAGAFALTDHPAPNIQVDYAAQGSGKAVIQMLRTLAPPNKRYGDLQLWSEALSKDEVEELLVKLHFSKVRTQNHGRTRTLRRGDGATGLIVTDLPFSNAMPDRRILDVILPAAQELAPQKHRQIEEAMAEIQDQDALPQNLRDLVIQTLDDNENVAKLAAQRLLKEDGRLSIHSNLAAEAIVRMLPHSPQAKLDVSAKPGSDMCLKESTWRQIVQLLSEDTVLSLDLRGDPDDACDHLLHPLLHARCEMDSFLGTIKSKEAINALASVSTSRTVVHIWMQSPLPLGSSFERNCKRLYVHTRTFDASSVSHEIAEDVEAGLSSPLHLPTHPPPWLEVDAHQESVETILFTIRLLAPPNKSFRDLCMPNFHLDKDRQQELLRALYNAGIRTKNSKKTCILPDKYRQGVHVLCISDRDPDDVTANS